MREYSAHEFVSAWVVEALCSFYVVFRARCQNLECFKPQNYVLASLVWTMDMDEEDDPSIVTIDNGSFKIVAGFVGNDAPRAVFPTVVGRPRLPNVMIGFGDGILVGDRALSSGSRAGPNKLISSPMKQGMVTNWDDMERIWHHTFYKELRVAPEEHPVVMADAVSTPKAEREKMTKILFETFNVPAFYVAPSPLFSLYSTGRTTGIAVESGHQRTDCVPIHEGRCISSAVRSLNVGGLQIGEYLQSMLNEKGYTFYGMNNIAERRPWEGIVHDIKEKLCCFSSDIYGSTLKQTRFSKYYTASMLEEREVAMDETFGPDIARIVHQYLPQSMTALWDTLHKPKESVKYEMPDGQILEIDSERFRAPEALFQPILIGSEENGISEMLCESIKCIGDESTAEIRDALCQNVVLCGGSSMFDGMDGRLQRELVELCGDSTKIKVIAPPGRKYSAWIGMSLFAQKRLKDSDWCTKDEYDEVGPAIVHRKCTGLC